MSFERPSWDDYFKDLVQLTSKRSACKKLHVGCIIIKENRIISQGYNGYLPGCPHNQIIREGHEVATVHAEQNAITDCAKRGVSCNGATAYITHFPCLTCTKLLLSSGINRINYINDYKNDDTVFLFLKNMNVPIYKV
tara:strand:- start:3693 stop:4106 length:414 start_codon:yes stop_codon:yes gene_type:complete